MSSCGGYVRMVIEITEWAHRPAMGRRAFAGRILEPGETTYKEFMLKPDPLQTESRYPAMYFDHVLDGRACACGCGELATLGRYVQGHDQRALHQRIERDFRTVDAFLDWYDQEQRGPSAQAAA
jgi:hypothetical protein